MASGRFGLSSQPVGKRLPIYIRVTDGPTGNNALGPADPPNGIVYETDNMGMLIAVFGTDVQKAAANRCCDI